MKSKLAELVRDSITLSKLTEAGVDNWCWYDEAFDDEYDEMMELDDEELLKSEGYEIIDYP